MNFGTRHQCNQFNDVMIAYNNVQIQRVYTVKYLGMQLDPNLSFQDHAMYLRKKTLGKIKLLG